MATTTEPQQLSNAILSFALEGSFPDDIAALPSVSETDLDPTLRALGEAKVAIEVHEFESPPDVASTKLHMLTLPRLGRNPHHKRRDKGRHQLMGSKLKGSAGGHYSIQDYCQ
jgi:hypothetical protein